MQDTLILPQSDLAQFPVGSVPLTARTAFCPRPLSRLKVQRILLPFDLSRSSISALRAVAHFAADNGTTIHLLHVVEPADHPGVEPKANRSDDKMAEAAERLLKHWVKRVVPDRVRTFVNIRIGRPVDLIVTRAIAARADLIVMTTRASSGHELQRSTAERVSRLAPCPVLTIPEKCAAQFAYSLEETLSETRRTILMPVDFSSAAEVAVSYGIAIASHQEAQLLLAHGADVEESDIPAVHDRLRLWSGGRLDDASHCATAVWPGGHSLFAILAEAIRAEASLIVLPTRAQPWAQRLRAGSITDGVLRQAPCPVLSTNENVSILKQ